MYRSLRHGHCFLLSLRLLHRVLWHVLPQAVSAVPGLWAAHHRRCLAFDVHILTNDVNY